MVAGKVPMAEVLSAPLPDLCQLELALAHRCAPLFCGSNFRSLGHIEDLHIFIWKSISKYLAEMLKSARMRMRMMQICAHAHAHAHEKDRWRIYTSFPHLIFMKFRSVDGQRI